MSSTEPRVLFYGRDADAVATAWNGEDRSFELVPASPGEGAAAVAESRVDCVVCHAGSDGDAAVFLERVREASDDVPVVVYATGDAVDSEAAMAVGATYVDVEGEFDPLDRLAAVTPLVERHREAVRERTMLDSLLEHIPLSVYWKDRQSRHVEVSDAMLSMIGPDHLENPEGKRFHAPADIEGNSDWDLYPADLAENATGDDREVMESEEAIVDRVEHSYGSPTDGTYVATSKAPWYDEQGRVVGLVGVTRDVSERMQYEHQLERQNERLERFAKVISHDLRNPLEVVRGRLALARDGDDPAEHFGAMERAVDRMDALIDDVLTLAREGEVVADPETVDLAAAAEAAWELVDAGDATLAIETEAHVMADPGRLQQVFENLFRNAVEHGSTSHQQADDAVEDGSTSERSGEDDAEDGSGTEHDSEDGSEDGSAADAPGGSDVTVTVGELPYHGFFVEDDGQGIPRDVRDEVFEPGFTSSEAGTGLGLGIVRSIAEAHGWSVEVAESDDGGARFEFWDVRRVPEDRA